jgi:hypothetical protein
MFPIKPSVPVVPVPPEPTVTAYEVLSLTEKPEPVTYPPAPPPPA